MGALSSKSKTANVTLLRKSSSSDNDATNSRSKNDTSNSIAATPKEKVLPFDPRSPAESFDRTPITVCARSNDVDTPLVPSATSAAAVKVLDIDPRSPSQQVSRTPIVVESPTTSSNTYKKLPTHEDSTPLSSRTVTKTSTVATVSSSSVSPKTSLANICTSSKPNSCDDCDDPRSPTVTVPRTPLEDKQFEVTGNSRDLCDGITKRLLFNQSACDSTANYEETELQDIERNTTDDSIIESSDDDEEGKESSKTKRVESTDSNSNRKPLASVQNSGSRSKGTPRAMLQAKQCRTLEEEFSKNQRNILSQLVQDDSENIAPVPSTTQFVEEI